MHVLKHILTHAHTGHMHIYGQRTSIVYIQKMPKDQSTCSVFILGSYINASLLTWDAAISLRSRSKSVV